MCRLLNVTNVEDSGCTSLRVHLGSLLASGPALALVLHLPVKCGSRTLDPGISLTYNGKRSAGGEGERSPGRARRSLSWLVAWS